jgi:hypothetical protein
MMIHIENLICHAEADNSNKAFSKDHKNPHPSHTIHFRESFPKTVNPHVIKN